MSRSSWIVAFALGLAASVSSAQNEAGPENEPRQDKSSTDSEQSRSEQQTAPVDPTPALQGIEAAIRALETDVDQIEQERRQEQERRDLQAQESMAKWAALMFYATAGTVLLTFMALVAIVRTLHHTRRAADYTEGMLFEAKATTAAAMETVNVTKEIGDRQVRPYLTYESGTIQVLHVEGDSPETMQHTH